MQSVPVFAPHRHTISETKINVDYAVIGRSAQANTVNNLDLIRRSHSFNMQSDSLADKTLKFLWLKRQM